MPLEVFVHGALCVSYSGQCLTSESLGGRSANRGQCAQACRLPYDLVVDGRIKDLGDKAYLLSPSDLAAYDLIGDLIDRGVASFKIEGRLKSAHYVAATCQTYRAAIDAKNAGNSFAISPSQQHDLEQTFSRGFTHGFLDGVNHQKLVAARFPKARGTRMGTVVSKTDRSVIIHPEVPQAHDRHVVGANDKHSPIALKPGDGVVFDEGHPEQDKQGGRLFAVKQKPAPTAHRPGKGEKSPAPSAAPAELELEFRDGDINLAAINPGAIVWKTDDPAIKRRLEHSFARETVARRVAVDFVLNAEVGEHLELIGRIAGSAIEARARWNEKPLEPASKFPITESAAREQLGRMGDTPFVLGNVTLKTGPTAHTTAGAMVPKSILNDLRRQVCAALQRLREKPAQTIDATALDTLRQEITQTESISPAPPQKSPADRTPETPALYVLVRTMEQLDALLAHTGPLRPAMVYVEFEDVRRYPDAVRRCRDAAMPVGLATLRIVKPAEHGFLKQVSDCRPDALLVRSLAAVGYYHERAPEIPLIGDYALNIANELTAAIFAAAGLVRMVPSYDLNWKQLAAMLARFNPARFECVIHQHMPMFHMEHCVFAHTLSNGKDFHDCGRPCERHRVDLRDRVGEAHPLIPDVGCRNTVFNAQAQTAAEFVPEMRRLGVRHFRVELLRETAEETARILDRYAGVLTGQESPAQTLRSLRVLNQLGVTRGTLVHE